jgi:hypothetical protein
MTVTFSLGQQGCTGTTDASGVVSCTIPKLTEKPGNYMLNAGFAGTGDYLPSSVTAGFNI